jgi:hypothetical protein
MKKAYSALQVILVLGVLCFAAGKYKAPAPERYVI